MAYGSSSRAQAATECSCSLNPLMMDNTYPYNSMIEKNTNSAQQTSAGSLGTTETEERKGK
jgi:hypothetical protein